MFVVTCSRHYISTVFHLLWLTLGPKQMNTECCRQNECGYATFLKAFHHSIPLLAYASRCYEVCIYYVLHSIYMPVHSSYFYGTTWKCVECSTSIWAHESASCYLRPGRTGRGGSIVLKTGKKTTQGGRRLLASGDLGGHGWEGHCWRNQVLGLIHSTQTVFPECVEASTAAN